MLTTAQIKNLTKDCKNILEVAEALYNRDCFRSDDRELFNAAYRVKSTAEKLQVMANRVKRAGEETAARITNHQQTWRDDLTFGPFYSGVNSLGELQGMGSEFDIACAKYADAIEHLNGVISARWRDERTAERKAQREAYTGQPAELLNYLEKNHRRTVKQIASDLGWDLTTTLTAVNLCADAKEPFVVRIMDRNNNLKEAFYQAEVR